MSDVDKEYENDILSWDDIYKGSRVPPEADITGKNRFAIGVTGVTEYIDFMSGSIHSGTVGYVSANTGDDVSSTSNFSVMRSKVNLRSTYVSHNVFKSSTSSMTARDFAAYPTPWFDKSIARSIGGRGGDNEVGVYIEFGMEVAMPYSVWLKVNISYEGNLVGEKDLAAKNTGNKSDLLGFAIYSTDPIYFIANVNASNYIITVTLTYPDHPYHGDVSSITTIAYEDLTKHYYIRVIDDCILPASGEINNHLTYTLYDPPAGSNIGITSNSPEMVITNVGIFMGEFIKSTRNLEFNTTLIPRELSTRMFLFINGTAIALNENLTYLQAAHDPLLVYGANFDRGSGVDSLFLYKNVARPGDSITYSIYTDNTKNTKIGTDRLTIKNDFGARDVANFFLDGTNHKGVYIIYNYPYDENGVYDDEYYVNDNLFPNPRRLEPGDLQAPILNADAKVCCYEGNVLLENNIAGQEGELFDLIAVIDGTSYYLHDQILSAENNFSGSFDRSLLGKIGGVVALLQDTIITFANGIKFTDDIGVAFNLKGEYIVYCSDPGDMGCNVYSDYFKFSWDPVCYATNYNLYYAVDDEDYGISVDLTGTTHNGTIGRRGGTVHWQVTASNDTYAGERVFGNDFTVPATTPTL
ncbi:MAG: hypothetical protein KAH32_04760 [Chlamydiia bacterium]|nr:hypothetical protein [Chlamydiia bacterium]